MKIYIALEKNLFPPRQLTHLIILYIHALDFDKDSQCECLYQMHTDCYLN